MKLYSFYDIAYHIYNPVCYLLWLALVDIEYKGSFEFQRGLQKLQIQLDQLRLNQISLVKVYLCFTTVLKSYTTVNNSSTRNNC